MGTSPALDESGRSSWWWSRGTYGEDVKSELTRRAMQLIVEKALEARVRDTLGRGDYERCGGSDPGYRNGYRESGLKSAEGEERIAGIDCISALARG